MIKRVISLLMIASIILALSAHVFASSSEVVDVQGETNSSFDLSPMSGDVFNVILILVCISGTALIILLLFTLSSKK